MSHFDEEELKHIAPGPLRWMASNPVAANCFMLICLIGGFLILGQSKQEVFPEFSVDLVTTTMNYPGASPEEVEQGIILAIEDAIKDVDGIKEISSSAYEGYGHVLAEIEESSADESIRITQDIKTAVDQITTFPVDAENLTVSLATNQEIVLNITLHGDVSEIVLRNTAEMVRDRFEAEDDINLVEFPNVLNHEIHIEVSQDNLRRYGLSIPEISTIIRDTSIEVGGGSLKTSAGEILVRMDERRDYADEFQDIPIIKNANGATVYLSDIATISEGFEDKIKYAHFDGKPAIEMTINTTGKQTPSGVSAAARKVIKNLKNELPDEIDILITQDRSIMFQQRANLLINNGLLGLILVVVFLALFLDIRLAFWVSMGIPISYMGAFLILGTVDGFSINMVSMFAFIIALGIVVDDAVVVGENIYHKREMGIKPLQASVTGVREMSIPVMVSVITNIVAFTPMLFMPGFMGKIFSIIPMIVISTFILSLLESLFILPAHLTFKQSKKVKNKALLSIISFQKGFNKRFDSFVQNIYAPFLKISVSFRYISLSVFMFVLIVMGGYVGGGYVGIQLFPIVEADYSYAKAVLKVGAPEKEINDVQNRMISAAHEIIDENGKEQLSRGIYTSVNENTVEIKAYLTDTDTRTISTENFTDLWRSKIGMIEGLESLAFQADQGGPGAGADLTVELGHNDTDTLEEAAIALAKALEDFPSAQDIDDGAEQGKKQFDFTLTDLGYTLGLTPTDVGRQVRGSFYGSEAAKQQRGRNEVRILVKLTEEERESAYFFQNMMIKAPNGSDVMLSDVVEATEGRAYTTISRREGRRVVTVQANVDPPSETNLILSSIQGDILPELQKRYPGLSYSFEGQQADMLESLSALGDGMIIVSFVMYGILAILFKSYVQPIMIMIAIPFSVVGAIIGHYIMGFSLSLVSMFGIIALSGVVINDSLILIDLANRKRHDGMALFDAVVHAATQRFRPILLTTLTTFVGLAPMMFETSRQALFLIPMAISLGYGIIFATFLTLVLIPSLYMIIDDIKKGCIFIKEIIME